MKIACNIHRAFRGEIGPKALALELLRRGRASLRRQHERAHLDHSKNQAARLSSQFDRLTLTDLLAHFKQRTQPQFFNGPSAPGSLAKLQRELFPAETTTLIRSAERIVANHSWPLFGFGEKHFGAE